VLLDLTSENIFITKSQYFFISTGWLPGAEKENCITRIPLLKSNKVNTYSRTLTSTSYNWFPLVMKDTTWKNTVYAVELDEMK
jgi:hypothetical protein